MLPRCHIWWLHLGHVFERFGNRFTIDLGRFGCWDESGCHLVDSLAMTFVMEALKSGVDGLSVLDWGMVAQLRPEDVRRAGFVAEKLRLAGAIWLGLGSGSGLGLGLVLG